MSLVQDMSHVSHKRRTPCRLHRLQQIFIFSNGLSAGMFIWSNNQIFIFAANIHILKQSAPFIRAAHEWRSPAILCLYILAPVVVYIVYYLAWQVGARLLWLYILYAIQCNFCIHKAWCILLISVFVRMHTYIFVNGACESVCVCMYVCMYVHITCMRRVSIHGLHEFVEFMCVAYCMCVRGQYVCVRYAYHIDTIHMYTCIHTHTHTHANTYIHPVYVSLSLQHRGFCSHTVLFFIFCGFWDLLHQPSRLVQDVHVTWIQ